MRIDKADYIRSAFKTSDFLRDGRPEIAFVGRSNVGKSSLLNRLLGRKKLARISSTPGRTRAVNYFLINDRFYFVDLPGYGYAKAGKEDRRAWAKTVDSYLEQAFPGAHVVMLVDAKVGATKLDVTAFEYLQGFGASVSVAATKIDKVGRSKRTANLARIRRELQLGEENELLPVSARTGEGIQGLWKALGPHLHL